MTEGDEIKSKDTRYELDSSGATVFEPHETKAVLTDGLAAFFRIDGAPVAVVGSSGKNRSPDHKKPKKGKVLVPLDATIRIASGEGLLKVEGKSVATTESEVMVPDVHSPRKKGVVTAGADLLKVNGRRVVRGKK